MPPMSSRLEEIQSIIAQLPDDPFPRYGLALEYKNLGQLDEARGAFAELQERHPGYVPQYLMHGNLLVQMKDRQAARAVYERGIAAAQAARNQHALGELRQALDALDEPEDD